jgi:formylglycine-generating enzyme required for sulfatase activity
MERVEKTVFISYRRKDISWALAVYQYLTSQEYDVFFDYTSLSGGDFEQVIVSNIKARAHFVLILTPTALDRCNEPGDWLRREIETAVDEKRNIIPLFFDGFSFGSPSVVEKLTGKLGAINHYNGLDIPAGYFLEAMERLHSRYLNVPLNAVLHPVTTEVRKVVKQEQRAADKALLRKHEYIAKPKKPVEKEPGKPRQDQDEKVTVFSSRLRRENGGEAAKPNLRPYGIGAGIFLAAALGILAVNSLIQNAGEQETTSPTAIPTHTAMISPTPTATAVPPTPVPTLDIGSSMISPKDSMTLLYVPAGEFIMGSDEGPSNETPVHPVFLDAFWIDQNEVTNEMYALCVEAGVCREPTNNSSNAHSIYFGSAEFDDYPVIYVDWNMAKTYCEWAGRRLPSEAEWEKAARGTDQRVYPWGDGIDRTFANYGAYVGDTTAVRNYESGKSLYGAYDMAGNVWEWVSSSFKPYPFDAADGRENLTASNLRVLRGGSWGYNDVSARSTYRWHGPSDSELSVIGFRCALSE